MVCDLWETPSVLLIIGTLKKITLQDIRDYHGLSSTTNSGHIVLMVYVSQETILPCLWLEVHYLPEHMGVRTKYFVLNYSWFYLDTSNPLEFLRYNCSPLLICTLNIVPPIMAYLAVLRRGSFKIYNSFLIAINENNKVLGIGSDILVILFTHFRHIREFSKAGIAKFDYLVEKEIKVVP